MINPDDHIIVRKRKKYKFAKFANSPLCFEFDDWNKLPIDVIEIGAGTGLFSVQQAVLHPEKRYLALDVKADRLQKGAYEAQSRGLTNLHFVRARADQLLDVVDKESLQAIWLTFPDPFPKKGSARRRLTHPIYLEKYRHALTGDGAVCFKTDARDLFLWSLEQFVAEGWNIDELSFDLHESNLSDVYKAMTTFETRWRNEGIPINYGMFVPRQIGLTGSQGRVGLVR